MKEKNKNKPERITTLRVTHKTWKHVKDNRILGETVNQTLQRLLGIADTNDSERTPFMVIKK